MDEKLRETGADAALRVAATIHLGGVEPRYAAAKGGPKTDG
jgi:hypothetical protein